MEDSASSGRGDLYQLKTHSRNLRRFTCELIINFLINIGRDKQHQRPTPKYNMNTTYYIIIYILCMCVFVLKWSYLIIGQQCPY